ncbi:MAG: carbon-nitrogen hydrolase family protein [Chitinophagaceae bacterium]
MATAISETVTLALVQTSPVWLQKEKTIEKIINHINDAAAKKCDIVVFGEAFLPGYPFWIELTDGAKFESRFQKEMHAWYMQQAVQIEAGDLQSISSICKQKNIAAVIGTIELAADRGNHSLYCSLIYIDKSGTIQSIHRKLMPTYEERLSWSQGDGHGLRVHPLGKFTVGALNCWENWMPLVRSALYAQGEDLHIAIWPGSVRNTVDITRFIAKESRSFVVSVSSILQKKDIDNSTPHASEIIANASEWLADGGTCVAGPDGNWVLPPQEKTDSLFVVTINHQRVREERQNFDASGHYARPDVVQLQVNRQRQSVINIKD